MCWHGCESNSQRESVGGSSQRCFYKSKWLFFKSVWLHIYCIGEAQKASWADFELLLNFLGDLVAPKLRDALQIFCMQNQRSDPWKICGLSPNCGHMSHTLIGRSLNNYLHICDNLPIPTKGFHDFFHVCCILFRVIFHCQPCTIAIKWLRRWVSPNHLAESRGCQPEKLATIQPFFLFWLWQIFVNV